MLIAVLVMLNIADGILTVRIIKKGGKELNPVMVKIMSWLGTVPALAVSKVLVLALYGWLAFVAGDGWAYSPHVTAALCAWYGLAVCNNWRQLAGQA
jgi:hypothetical protein